jgi:hypothetical protein
MVIEVPRVADNVLSGPGKPGKVGMPAAVEVVCSTA